MSEHLSPLRPYEPEPSGEDVVERHWPYDTAGDVDAFTDAARALAMLVRYCTNATHTDRMGTVSAPQMDTALSPLLIATRRLPQLFRQLGEWAEQASHEATLRHDNNDPDNRRVASLTAGLAAQDLRDAGSYADALHEALDSASEHLSHLYHDDQP